MSHAPYRVIETPTTDAGAELRAATRELADWLARQAPIMSDPRRAAAQIERQIAQDRLCAVERYVADLSAEQSRAVVAAQARAALDYQRAACAAVAAALALHTGVQPSSVQRLIDEEVRLRQRIAAWAVRAAGVGVQS
jgi:hypothetical protein